MVQMRAENSQPGYMIFEKGESDSVDAPVTTPPRIYVASNGTFMMGHQPVVLAGANYIVKAKPYFPPLTVVRRNAQLIAEQARKMSYKPTDGRKTVPFVRLGLLMEAGMPNGPGPVDAAWASKLDRVVRIFSEQGVYVLLDNQHRAFTAPAGGFGLPWWMAKHMQDTTRHAGESFVASAKHIPHTVISDELVTLAKYWNLTIPIVESDRGTSWDEFSVEEGTHPELMNIGNKNMRLNNHERAGDSGQLYVSHQVQNFALRFYNSHQNARDRKMLFKPFVTFVSHLSGLWSKYTNVIAVELISEPLPGGLPNILLGMTSRPSLYSFYQAVLEELEDQELYAPVLINDIFAGLPGANAMFAQAYILPLTYSAVEKLSMWAMKGRLIFAFNYVPGTVTMLKIPQLVGLAKKAASQFRCHTVLLTDFATTSAQSTADVMASSLELGLDGVSYGDFVDTEFTGTPGWYKYPSYVGRLFDEKDELIPSAWPAYKKSVLAGEYWGAEIFRSHSGKMHVLDLMTNAGARRDHVREEFLPPKGSGPASG